MQKKVLVLDDDEIYLELLKNSLPKFLEIISLSNSLEISTALHRKNVDLLITDIVMPDLSGLDVIKIVREFSNLPIIAVSAYEKVREEALRAGANIFIEKSNNFEELIISINSVLD